MEMRSTRLNCNRSAGFVLLLALAFQSSAAFATQLGVYKGAGCTGAVKLPLFQQFLGRKVDRVLDFLDQRSWSLMQQSLPWILSCWAGGPAGLTLSVPMLPQDGVSTLSAGAAGAYDRYFRAIAQAAVTAGRSNTIMRIGWEFNGRWYPWAATKDPASFVAFWRRIVTVMREVNGQHFQFDWCFTLSSDLGDPSAHYPGDDVVDIISADVYDQYWWTGLADPTIRWNNFVNQRYGLLWHRNFAATHHKPIAFAEWATGTTPDRSGAGDDPIFINKMANWIATNNTLYHNYWDYHAADFNGQLSNRQFPNSAAAYVLDFAHTQ